MFTNSSLRNFQESTYRTAVMAIIVTIIKMYVLHDSKATFDKTWLIVTLSKILGFGLYDLFFYRIVDSSKFKVNEKLALKDIMYFGGMLFMKDYVVSYYKETDFNPSFLKNFTLLSVGFTVYHLFIKERILKLADPKADEVNKKSNSKMLTFAKKIFFGLFITDILPHYNDREKLIGYILPDLFVLVLAFPFYFLVARKLLSKILN